MEKEWVNVLISTYNGEKYIAQQMESILNQTYPNIKIYVRDDGSQDGTVRILSEYQERLGKDRFQFFAGENKGFGKSFLRLLEIAEEGDYWAFCDQDDVWKEEKISCAVEWFRKQKGRKPRMYHSSFLLTDESLHPTGKYLPPAYAYDFVRSITDCLHMGFSDVINGELRSMMLQGDQSVLTTHDHWAELLVMEFGEVFFDDRILTLHRRLDSSLSSSKMKSRLQWLRGALKGGSEILPSARECFRVFGGQMKERDRKVLEWFVYEKYDWKKSLKKAFYPRRWRPSASSELVVRLLMLLGKI